MSEKTRIPKKEIQNPEIIVRLAAKKLVQKAEKDLYAQFPTQEKTEKKEIIDEEGESVVAGDDESALLFAPSLEEQSHQEEIESTEERGIGLRKRGKGARGGKGAHMDSVRNQLPSQVVVASSSPSAESVMEKELNETTVDNLFVTENAAPSTEVNATEESTQLTVLPTFLEGEVMSRSLDTKLSAQTGKKNEEREGSGLYKKIDRLTTEANELRTLYVKEDFENAAGWKKIFSLFTIKKDEKKGDWRALYEEKILELQKAESEMMQGNMAGEGTALSKKDTKEGMEKLLRYYKLGEQVNVANERTEYRAERQNLPEKVSGIISDIGKSYNKLSFAKKMLLAGTMIGGSLLIAPVSGAAAGAIGGLAVIKRFAASAGVAVAVEGALEKFSEKRSQSKADAELTRQIARLEGSLEDGNATLFEKMMEAEIADLDTKLHKEKKAKIFRKLGAATVGGVVGYGWLWDVGMNVFGGKEAVEGIKDHFVQASQAVPLSVPFEESAEKLPTPQEILDTETTPTSSHDKGVVFGNDTHTERTSHAAAETDQVEVESEGEVEARVGVSEQFQNIERNPYAVQVEEFLLSTDEMVAKILQENQVTPASETVMPEAMTQEAEGPVIIDTVLSDSSVAPEVVTVPSAAEIAQAATPSGAEAAAEMNVDTGADGVEHAESLGKELQELREVTALREARADEWYAQIFRVENSSLSQDWILNKESIEHTKIVDLLQDARLFKEGALSGYTTGLSREQISHFAEFFQGVTKSDIAFDRISFFKENPSATVAEYLDKIASQVNPGKRIGIFTTTK